MSAIRCQKRKAETMGLKQLWRNILFPRDLETNLLCTVVCKIVHKFASVWCKTALEEVGVSLP